MKYLKQIESIDNLNRIIETDEYVEPSVYEIGGPDNIIYNYRKKLFKKPVLDKTDYLSIYTMSDGEFVYSGSATIEYNKNGAGWETYSGSISCSEGDIINLRGNNSSYNGCHIDYTGKWILYGNTDSLINSNKDDDFHTAGYSNNVFNGLFSGDSTLMSISELTINAYSGYACKQMFKDCTKLIYVLDNLISESGSSYTFQEMFSGCESIENVNNLTIVVNGTRCCDSMFKGCIKLQSVPQLIVESVANYTFASMFFGCTNLESAYINVTLADSSSYCCQSMFEGCVNLRKIPKFSGFLDDYAFNRTFYGCTSIESLPNDYFGNITCNSTSNYACSNMFAECTNLKIVPDLIETPLLPTGMYKEMFSGCTSLKQVGDIKSWGTNSWSCQKMFYNCVSLEQSPIIYVNYHDSYSGFDECFRGCTNLKTVVAFFGTDPGTTNWLTNTSDNGTIYLLKDTSLPVGPTGIPESWTIRYFNFDTISTIVEDEEYNVQNCPNPSESAEIQWNWWYEVCSRNYLIVTNNNRIFKVVSSVSGSNSSTGSWVYTVYIMNIGDTRSPSYGTLIAQKRIYNSSGETVYSKEDSALTTYHPKYIITDLPFTD